MDLQTRTTLLCTGVSRPLLDVSATLALLDAMLAGSADDRATVTALRDACVSARPLPADLLATFVRCGFATPDGALDPTTVDVVRAAVRGEAADLHLSSPYVRRWDRVLSELLNSRESVRAALPADQAERLIAETLPEETVLTNPAKRWLDYVYKRRPPSGGPFSPSVN